MRRHSSTCTRIEVHHAWEKLRADLVGGERVEEELLEGLLEVVGVPES